MQQLGDPLERRLRARPPCGASTSQIAPGLPQLLEHRLERCAVDPVGGEHRDLAGRDASRLIGLAERRRAAAVVLGRPPLGTASPRPAATCAASSWSICARCSTTRSRMYSRSHLPSSNVKRVGDVLLLPVAHRVPEQRRLAVVVVEARRCACGSSGRRPARCSGGRRPPRPRPGAGSRRRSSSGGSWPGERRSGAGSSRRADGGGPRRPAG